MIKNTKNGRAIMSEILKTDNNHVRYFHPAKGDIKTVLEYNQNLIKKGATFYYTYVEGGRPTGYFIVWKEGKSHQLLDFCMCSWMRTGEGEKNFFQAIESKLKTNYLCYLYHLNNYGTEFLKKQGLKEAEMITIGDINFKILV